METYIIRIYRREKENPEQIVGTIEEVGAESVHNFKNQSEIYLLLKRLLKND